MNNPTEPKGIDSPKLSMFPPLPPPVPDWKEVVDAIQNTEYAIGHIRAHMQALTEGERRSLFRAVLDVDARVGTPEGIGGETDLKEALAANERDRTQVYIAITALDKELAGRDWLRESRGSYEWNDDRWHSEFGVAVDAIVIATDPLRRMKNDLTNCPPTLAEASVIRGLVDRAEKAEAELAALKNPTPEPLGETAEKMRLAMALLSRYRAKCVCAPKARECELCQNYRNIEGGYLNWMTVTAVPAKSEEGESAPDAWHRAFEYVYRHGWDGQLDGRPDYVAPKKPSTEEEVGG